MQLCISYLKLIGKLVSAAAREQGTGQYKITNMGEKRYQLFAATKASKFFVVQNETLFNTVLNLF